MTMPQINLKYIPVLVDHPPDPRPGDLCRVGTMVGIMIHNQLYEFLRKETGKFPTLNMPIQPHTGEYEFHGGRKPVSFQPTTHRAIVRNEGQDTAKAGTVVYYFDHPVGPNGKEAHAATGDIGTPHDAVAGILLEAIEAGTTIRAPIMMQYVQRDWHWLSCPAVDRTPGLCGSAWVFRNTRIPLHQLFDHIQQGGTVQEFLDDFPDLSKEQVQTVLRHEIADLEKYPCPPEPRYFPPPEAAPRQ